MTTKTKWTMNETQKAFVGALGDGSVKSLRQINAELGKDIKTGSVNTLITKGIVVSVADGVEYNAEIVETRVYANGLKVVINKQVAKTETGYKLA